MPNNLTITIFKLNSEFTGRNVPGFPGGYDANKRYRLHPRNRAEVWKHKHRQSLLESILSNRYIPPIIVNRVGTTAENQPIYDILDGGNRVTAFRRILDGGEFQLTEEQRLAVCVATIDVVILDGMTPEQIRDQFRLLNRSVKVSHGHLYHMSTEDSPLVQYAYDIMHNVDNPLHVKIVSLFTEKALMDNDSKSTLENVVALCAGAQHGEYHLSRSFDVNESILRSPIDKNLINTRLTNAFEVFVQANILQPMEDSRIKRGDFNVGRYLAGILYDMLDHGKPTTPTYEPAPTDIEPVINKWKDIISRIHANDMESPIAIAAVTVPGANNINPRKLRRMSKQVEFYLTHERLPNEDELKELISTIADDVSTFEEDEQSVDED